MKVTFWGCRGSHPTPLSPDAVRSKIATVVQRVRAEDLRSAETRERFLAALPPWLFGTVGGNTACLQLELNSHQQIIFDAGSGIVPFGYAQLNHVPRPSEYHIFFTHFHYDHIQGLPFFPQAYDPRVAIHFYSPNPDLRAILSSQMSHPLFPITMEDKMSNLHFHCLDAERAGTLFGATIRTRALNHPGGAFAYRVDHRDRAFCYCTDVELLESDFLNSSANRSFFGELDAIVLDTQYTLDEAVDKNNWGHSSFSLGVDFAIAWGIPRLYLFHHEPQYTDRKLYHNLEAARAYAHRSGGSGLQVFLAIEGDQIEL